MLLTATNGQQKSIAATNNITIRLITDDFLLSVTNIHVFKDVKVNYFVQNVLGNRVNIQENRKKSLEVPQAYILLLKLRLTIESSFLSCLVYGL